MKQIVTCALYFEACPLCKKGSIYLMSVALETCPETEADVEFTFNCNQCDAVGEVWLSSQIEKGHHFVSMQDAAAAMRSRRGW